MSKKKVSYQKVKRSGKAKDVSNKRGERILKRFTKKSPAKEETSVKRPSARISRDGIGGKTSIAAKNNERNIKTTKSTATKGKRQVVKTVTSKTKEKTTAPSTVSLPPTKTKKAKTKLRSKLALMKANKRRRQVAQKK